MTDENAALEWRAEAQRGRYDLAARSYRFGGGDDPALLDALESLADVLVAVRDKSYARARTILERIEAHPEPLDWEALHADLAALSDAARALDHREPEAAKEHLAKVGGSAYPGETATLLGTLAVFEGDTAAARERFEQALELDPNHYRALTNLGNIMLEEGDVDGAIASYERAIKLNESFANAHHNLGVALRRKGQLGRSVQALKRAQRESGKRDAEEARARLGSRGGRGGGLSAGGAGRSGGAGAYRWLLWLAIAAALVWFIAGR
jgi:tetratricopeptide (TPR) repeat protein